MLQNLTTKARNEDLRKLGLPNRVTVTLEYFEPEIPSQAHLAVAHLPDGRPVMVLNGAEYVGQEHEVVFTSVSLFPSVHLCARIPAKTTYDYRSLVEAITAARKSYDHQDFNDYYTALAKCLRKVLGLRLESEERNLELLLDSTFSSLRAIRHPLSGWLEATSTFATLERKGALADVQEQMDRIVAANKESERAHLALLYKLFEVLYGKSDMVVTSNDLWAAGFDDTAEPEIRYYDDFV